MSLNIRALLLVVFPALLVALGCASTASVPEEAALEPAAIDDPKDSHESLGSVSLNPVYFETDRAQLRPEARDALKHHAKTILDHPEWGVVTIEGHCDSRGSDEYNLALGSRRASGVERYLTDMGVQASRLSIQSLGEERPAVGGEGETAWRYNRRSELRIKSLQATDR
jgi:peptidoglycan-associated lipoprotein